MLLILVSPVHGAYRPPSAKVTWSGAQTWTSSATFQDDQFSVGGSTLVVTEGTVGIGTDTPGAELHVYTTGANADLYVDRGDGADVAVQALASAGNVGTLGNYPLRLVASGSPYVTISGSGDITMGSAITNSVSFGALPGLPSDADPRTNVTPTAAGQLIYNTALDSVCVSTGTTSSTWAKIEDPTAACE